MCCQVMFASQLSALVALSLLLLRAGDIELNPGPTRVDKDEFLQILVGKLCSLQAKWLTFGVLLGVKKDILDTFETKHNGNPMRCLTDVFDHWLKENTKTPVTWETIIKILRSDALCENALANDLEAEYVRNELQDQETDQEITDFHSGVTDSEIELHAESEQEIETQENTNSEQQDVSIAAQVRRPHGSVKLTAASSQVFKQVEKRFQQKWSYRKGPPPAVHYVFIIDNASHSQKWQNYRLTLEDQEIKEHYHGTKLTCDITKDQRFCANEDCGVCGISCEGFDQNRIGDNGFLRFGRGIYLAPNSSKCHDYTQGAHGYRALVVCDVCPGKKYTMEKDDPNSTGPPDGFDSVHGSGRYSESLNFDEIVVQNPHSILPKYIIVYQKDGEGKIQNECNGKCKRISNKEYFILMICAIAFAIFYSLLFVLYTNIKTPLLGPKFDL